MSEQQFAADDGFYIEIAADAGRVLDLIDPDQDLTDEALVVTPLFPPEWIEHDALGIPGPPGTPNFVILGLPGGPQTVQEFIDSNPPSAVVYRVS